MREHDEILLRRKVMKSWDSLEYRLQEVRTLMERGENYRDSDLVSIGFGRVLEKAVAIEEHKVTAVAEQMRELAEECNLEMSGFTDGEALKAWSIGQQKWKEAREEVLKWLPAS